MHALTRRSRRLGLRLLPLASLIALLTAMAPAAAQASSFSCSRDSYTGQSLALNSWANGGWVAAEYSWSDGTWGALRARSSTVGSWERYYIYCNSDGTFSLLSPARGAYGEFVSAELGYGGSWYGLLRARAGSIGPWEKFIGGWDGNGAFVFQSAANGQFVSMRKDWYNVLRASASSVGPWEEFSIRWNV